jgi:hypothetical protein
VKKPLTEKPELGRSCRTGKQLGWGSRDITESTLPQSCKGPVSKMGSDYFLDLVQDSGTSNLKVDAPKHPQPWLQGCLRQYAKI